MVTQASLVGDLQSIVGAEYARVPKDEEFAVDGMRPQVIVEPGSYAEVAAAMCYANNAGLAVIALGNGHFSWIGNIPSRYDIALSVSRLNAVVEYEPADLTITCQAGTTLDDVHGLLTGNGQMIPFGWGAGPARISRLLALARGESHLAWGSARDFTIGMRVVTAEGRTIRAGGKVVKNVAGYDLCKLFIGSMGTLGIIIEASLKLAPAPQAEELVDLEFTSLSQACNFAWELRKRGLALAYVNLDRPMSITEEGAMPRGLVRLGVHLAGTTAGVERSRREMLELAPIAGGKLDGTSAPKLEGALPAWTNGGHPITCEARVLPSSVSDLVEHVDREAPGVFLNVSPLTGSVSMTWVAGLDEDRVRRLRAITTRLDGSLVVTGCDIELKRRIDVFGDPPPSFELMRRVKQQFDPNGILSPGRFVGRL